MFCKNSNIKVTKRNKKFVSLVILSILIIILTIMLGLWLMNKSQKKYSLLSSNELISYNYNENNILKFVDGKFSNHLVKTSEDVMEALETIKEKIGFKNSSEELRLVSQEKSMDITYYKFNQIYNNIPVLYQNIIVSVDKNNNILGYSGSYIPNINIEIIPKINKEEIEQIIKKNVGENPIIVSNELKIWASDNQHQLIYHILGYSDIKSFELIIDAHTGRILSEESLFKMAKNYTYTGEGIDNKIYTINLEEFYDINTLRTRYRFIDSLRNIHISDYYRYSGPILATLISALPGTNPIDVDIKNGEIKTDWDRERYVKIGVTTMAQFETIYDYYKKVLGRNSYDNKGSKIIVNIGVTENSFSNKDLNNAFWMQLTNQMYIGDWNRKSFSNCLDVLGHEFTHGVIQHIADFSNTAKEEERNKAFETGALNEGYSDILGSLIEGKNWTIGEDIEIIRDASHPEKYKDPSIKGGKYYYPDGYLKGRTIEQFLKDNDLKSVYELDKGGMHINSNIVTHAAYLMFEDGAFDSREEMAKVWYNSLFLLHSYSNFEDCALAVIKTAKNLGLKEESIYKITKAFQDTNMLENKNLMIKGTIKSGQELLKDAQIKVYSYNDNSEITTVYSNEQGEYQIELQLGTYKIEFTKDKFVKLEKIITLNGETILDVNLALQETKKDNLNFSNLCKTNQCYELKIYFLENGDQNKLEEKYETIAIDSGTIIDEKSIVQMVNDFLGQEILSSNGKSFFMMINGFKIEYAWYYKNTQTKFEFGQPIYQDTEIELKLLNGILDNDIFININDLFNQ